MNDLEEEECSVSYHVSTESEARAIQLVSQKHVYLVKICRQLLPIFWNTSL